MTMTTYSVLGIQSGFRMIAEYSEKDEIKAAGFKWEPGMRIWYTTSFEVAKKMECVADSEAKNLLTKGSFPVLTGRPPGMCEDAWNARRALGEK